jgi:hypothetical protein
VAIRPDITHLLNCKIHCSWRINYTVLLNNVLLQKTSNTNTKWSFIPTIIDSFTE